MEWTGLAHPILVAAAAGTLLCVFLRGAAHKLSDFGWFSHTLAEYRILPRAWAVPASALLLVLEVIVALGVIVPMTRPLAAGLGVTLLALYSAAMAVNLARGLNRIDCGCGGAGQSLSWLLVARNLALTGLALVAMQVPIDAAMGLLGWSAAAATVASFWLLLVGLEKIAENGTYLAASDEAAALRHEVEVH